MNQKQNNKTQWSEDPMKTLSKIYKNYTVTHFKEKTAQYKLQINQSTKHNIDIACQV